MSQDSQEIKTIEQWRWSEMQGLELVSASPLHPFNTNNNPPTPLHTATPPQHPLTPHHDREMEDNNPSSSSSEPNKDNGGREKPGDVPSIGFGELFRFADGLDYVLMGIGSVGAFVHGCSLPLFLRFFADLVNSFGSNANNIDKMMQEVLKVRTEILKFSLSIKLMTIKSKLCACDFAVRTLLSCCGCCNMGIFMGWYGF